MAVPELDQSCLAGLRGPLGVAVSGGGDSIALLHLLHRAGIGPLYVVTVDHGLRPGSAAEAIAVADAARKLGLSHQTLRWEDHPERGNLQAAARAARLRLIGGWARKYQIEAVLLGHTADDQAETFLQRLERGSGVDGLAAMAPERSAEGVRWLRPLLGVRRQALRDWLAAENIPYVDDPSNSDPRFGRVRMRAMLGSLSNTGIDADKIAKTTTRLRSARAVLFTAARDLGRSISQITPHGELWLDLPRLLGAQEALRLRLFGEALRFMGGDDYAPRAAAVSAALEALEQGQAGQSLGGCLLRLRKDRLILRREPAAVGPPVRFGTLWDGRWMIDGPDAGLQIRALGTDHGLPRPDGLAAECCASLPGIFDGPRLIAAPHLQDGAFAARFTPRNPFFTANSSQT